MRRPPAIALLTALVISLCLQSAAAQETSPSKKVLAEGTPVHLKLAERLNSRAAKQGDAVELTLAEDLKVGDSIVVKAGARALGTVVHTRKPDFWGEAGELNIRVIAMKAGSVKVPLRGAMGDTGVRYVIIRGSQAILQPGTLVIAFVDKDTELGVEP